MKDRLNDALKHSTADYAEIRLETVDATRVAYRGKEVEAADSTSKRGGIVRACTRGGWGVVTFESWDDLERQVREACRCAALVGQERTELAEVEPVDAECPAELEYDFRGVGLDAKLKLIGDYNAILLGAAPDIESSVASYTEAFRTVWFASARGAYYMEERPRITCALFAVARDGSLVQRAHDSVSSKMSYAHMVGLDDRARAVSERASSLLRAPKPDGGPCTVILDPAMGGVFAHEAFGHMSEADGLYENPRLRDMMAVGRDMAGKDLNIVDEGSLPGSIGTQAFDDEGTPTRKIYLIREGVLAGHLHSLETAGKMGVTPTGNARAIRADAPPIVRMTTTYIENGDTPVADLFAGVDDGIYACDAFGGQTELEMFTFSAAYGYRIRKGEKAELLRDITLTGNLFETLKSIDGLGNDLQIAQTGGGCGKGGQSPLPVADGAPHMRIRNVVVGGG